jgi:hypothetical protein
MKWLTSRRRKLVLVAAAVALVSMVVLVVWSATRPAPNAIWVGQPFAGADEAAMRAGAVRVARVQDGERALAAYEFPGRRLISVGGKPDPSGGYRVSDVLVFNPGGTAPGPFVERFECPWSPWSLVPASLRPE